jgi:hypothetical protein
MIRPIVRYPDPRLAIPQPVTAFDGALRDLAGDLLETMHAAPGIGIRDRIFGISPDRGQFSKIERRREFLSSNLDRLRTLLGWPAPPIELPASVCEIYVSRDIYWWMRNPPYEVSTHFIRIDAFDGWLRAQGF